MWSKSQVVHDNEQPDTLAMELNNQIYAHYSVRVH